MDIWKDTVSHNFAGAIEGTNIRITELSETFSDSSSRKGYFSLNIQTMCDHKYCV